MTAPETTANISFSLRLNSLTSAMFIYRITSIEFRSKTITTTTTDNITSNRRISILCERLNFSDLTWALTVTECETNAIAAIEA
jgi:hypothetical protein